MDTIYGKALNLSMSTMVGLGWIVLAAAMTGLWLVQHRTRNAGIVDAGWTFGVSGLAVFFALAGPGWAPRRATMAVLFVLWGARLGLYLLRDRVIGKPEEGRYVTLRQQWHPHAARRFFWFFQAQALAALFFALPPLLASAHTRASFHALELAALALSDDQKAKEAQ